jgi:large subunit ribosomal protein L25
MSIELKLDATLRKEQGKGASRRLRRAKQVPAILYGAEKDAVALTVSEEQLLRLMREEAFFSQIIDVSIGGGKTEQVVLKDLQRHPFKPLVTHLDLQRIREGQTLRVHLPIHFLHEDTAKGVKQQGGVIHHDMIEVEIECLPKNLPEYLEVDLADLGMDEAVHVSQLKLPEGVTIPALDHDPDHDPAVVSIHAPRIAADEGEEEAGEEAAGAEASDEEEDKG